MPRLTRSDYAMPADQLAPALLGRVLVRVLADGTRLAGRVVETEAYMGAIDRAAHSYGNRRTARTEPMFGVPGTSYVYFTYGMHWCMNVSAAEEGNPEAVLIRALAPAEGIERMRELRTASRTGVGKRPLADRDLCSGPAKLCQAMSIGKALSGLDLTTSGEIWIERGEMGAADLDQPMNQPFEIATGPRIGLGDVGAWAEKPLRYWVQDDPNVSVWRKMR